MNRNIKKLGNLRAAKLRASSPHVICLPHTRIPLTDVLNFLEKNGYTVDEDNIVCRVTYDKKTGDRQEVPLSTLLYYPVVQITYDNGTIQKKEYRISAVDLSDPTMEFPIVSVEAEKLTRMYWLSEFGLEANVYPGSNNKEYLRFLVQRLGTFAKKKTVYQHIGLKQVGNEWVYLHAEGAVGSEAATREIEVEVPEALKRYALPNEKHIPQEAIKLSFEMLHVAKLPIMLSIIAFYFLAPWLEILRKFQRIPKFGLWLHGRTGSRKTSLACLALCLFGKFADSIPPASFRSTANSMEIPLHGCKDSVLLIDDYRPAVEPHEALRQATVAEKAICLQGDGIAKARATSTMSAQKELPPRGLTIFTGEDLPTIPSLLARIFAVEIKPNDVDLNLLTKMQKSSNSLSLAGKAYIEWILKNKDDIIESDVEECISLIRSQYGQKLEHGRFADTIGYLLFGLKMATTFWLEYGIIDEAEAQELENEAIANFLEIARIQGLLITQQKPSEKFLDALKEMLSNGSVFLKSKDPAKYNQNPYPRKKQFGKNIGYYDDQYIYLTPPTTYTEVREYLLAQQDKFPLTQTNLQKELYNEGIILVDREAHRINYTPKMTAKGEEPKRYLKVKFEYLAPSSDEYLHP